MFKHHGKNIGCALGLLLAVVVISTMARLPLVSRWISEYDSHMRDDANRRFMEEQELRLSKEPPVVKNYESIEDLILRE